MCSALMLRLHEEQNSAHSIKLQPIDVADRRLWVARGRSGKNKVRRSGTPTHWARQYSPGDIAVRGTA